MVHRRCGCAPAATSRKPTSQPQDQNHTNGFVSRISKSVEERRAATELEYACARATRTSIPKPTYLYNHNQWAKIQRKPINLHTNNILKNEKNIRNEKKAEQYKKKQQIDIHHNKKKETAKFHWFFLFLHIHYHRRSHLVSITNAKILFRSIFGVAAVCLLLLFEIIWCVCSMCRENFRNSIQVFTPNQCDSKTSIECSKPILNVQCTHWSNSTCDWT